MSLDQYSPTWTTDFTDWAGGGSQQVDPAVWAGSTVNRQHFWQYTNATQQNPTPGPSTPGWSMQDAIDLAKLHNKPLSLSETGAGNASTSPASFGPVDDPAYPQWLNAILSNAEASGVTIQNVNLWDVGDFAFSSTVKPLEAAAWTKYFGAGSVVAPPPVITLSAPGTVQEVSAGAGVTVTETITTSNLATTTVFEAVLTATGAIESAYQPITLINGAAAVSVRLAATGDTIRVVDNVAAPSVVATSSPVTITEPPLPTVTIGSGRDTLALQVSEDAWNGNAQFTVAVDGRQIGDTQTALALHSAGQTQTFNVLGTFAAGTHTATVNFLNNAYGGSPTMDRNLYVTGATIDGTKVSGATLTEVVSGPRSFNFLAPGTSGVHVDQPTNLMAGLQTITGTEPDPSQPIFLDWHTNGVPALSSTDWVQAMVSPTGSFSASINIDHPGVRSTLYFRIGSGPATAGWSATPA